MKHYSLDLSRVVLKLRRTKIIASLGPASLDVETIQRLIAAGAELFQLDCGHPELDHERLSAVVEAVRQLSADAGRVVGIIAELAGKGLRLGRLDAPRTLEAGAELALGAEAGEDRLPCLGPVPFAALQAGDEVLIDYGKMRLEVIASEPQAVRCRVRCGGALRSFQRLHLPSVSAPAGLSDRDREDATVCAAAGVDWLAVPDIREARDLVAVRLALGENGSMPLLAKIGTLDALEGIGPIMEAADGLLISRGELATEIAREELPIVQQELIRAALQARLPVVVGTQIFDSMVTASEPTRAEVGDVSSATLAGVDAVLLSDETAEGVDPVAAVEALDKSLRLVEGYQWKHGQFGQLCDGPGLSDPRQNLGLALSRAASQLSRDLQARAIVIPTASGGMARIVSASRPAAPVVAAHTSHQECRRMALYWGLIPQRVNEEDMAEPAGLARHLVKSLGLARAGQLFLLAWDLSGEDGLAATVTAISV